MLETPSDKGKWAGARYRASAGETSLIKALNMKAKQMLQWIVMVMGLTFMQSCASTSMVSANKFDYGRFPSIYADENVDVRLGAFFDPEEYWRSQEKHRRVTMQMNGSDRDFLSARRIYRNFTDEIEAGKSSFLALAFDLSPDIAIMVSRGALVFTIGLADSVVVVRDEGICVPIKGDIFSESRKSFHDSAESVFRLDSELQSDCPYQGFPKYGFARLPYWAAGGEILSLEIDPKWWIYSGPGVKEKPQWR